MPAKNLNEAFRFLGQKPVKLEEFDNIYIDADSGRGARVFDLLKLKLTNNPEGSFKFIFAGHRGCGKTTELIRLQKHINNDFIVLNFSVLHELDIMNIHYIELLIVTMERLFVFVNDYKIEIANEYIESIQNWIRSREIEQVIQKHFDAGIEAEVKSGLNIPLLVRFFGKFKAAAKASSSMKETLKTFVEPKISEFLWFCNRLIAEIKNKLSSINKKGLLIIIEDLDKAPMEIAENIFYEHSAQLIQLNCHCIFTFPISLLYHIRYKTIANNFEKPFVLPMIHVSDRDGKPFDNGINIMKAIIEQRVEPNLFEEPILKNIIKISGGCLWDLFRLLGDAIDYAVISGRKTVALEDFEYAYLSLKADYERTIAENKAKQITVDMYFDALKSCALDQEKKIKHTDVVLDLMHNLTILNYNGQNWNDVHPIVKDILKERKMI